MGARAGRGLPEGWWQEQNRGSEPQYPQRPAPVMWTGTRWARLSLLSPARCLRHKPDFSGTSTLVQWSGLGPFPMLFGSRASIFLPEKLGLNNIGSQGCCEGQMT